MKKLLFILMFVLTPAFASDELYPFQNTQDSLRFIHLTENFRCLVCQNQSIADSNAPLAIDLKNLVYQQLLAGNTDEQIKQYLIDRYGSYVVFEPPLGGNTFVLWLFPLILLLIGASIAYGIVRKARSLP